MHLNVPINHQKLTKTLKKSLLDPLHKLPKHYQKLQGFSGTSNTASTTKISHVPPLIVPKSIKLSTKCSNLPTNYPKVTKTTKRALLEPFYKLPKHYLSLSKTTSKGLMALVTQPEQSKQHCYYQKLIIFHLF